ncbi:DNA primase [Streptomyces sp. NPDC059743]|uniref:DNA primase n=1 Tax=Streptomyces sp. NPDC059743 TaxID=3346928 RepID=UPI003661D75E
MKTTSRTCEQCGEDLPLMARQHARYCDTRCRSKAFRAKKNALPTELTTRARWVRRSATKVPLTSAGKAASSTDERTWSTYKDAAASTIGVGLGFVLSDEDDIVCLDLDHCLNPLTGRLAPWAAAILRDAGATYVEVSPSGDGLHIWGRADVRQGRRIRRSDGYSVEVYGTGRYMTVTGDRLHGAPSTLRDLSALVSELT